MVEELLKSLLGSPEHRANILNPDLSKIGISFAQDKDQVTDIIDMDVIGDSRLGYGTVVICQLFMKESFESFYPNPFPEKIRKNDSISFSATTYKLFDTVKIEMQESGGKKLIRSSEIALFENHFSEMIRFHKKGEYDLRISGVSYDESGDSVTEELATFVILVE